MSQIFGKFRAVDVNGDALSGGLVYFYQPGTTTLKDTYSDKAQTVANTNPVVLNSRGEAQIWGSGLYDMKLTTSAGATIYTLSNVGDDTGTISYTNSVSGASATTLQIKLDNTVLSLVADFGASGDGTTSDVTAIRAALATGKKVTGNGLTFAVDDYINVTASVHLIDAKFKRTGQLTGNAMFQFSGASVILDNVEFDGNKASVTSAVTNVTIAEGCSNSILSDCVFKNAKYSSGYGTGLMYNIDLDTTDNHVLRNCKCISNDTNGLEIYSGTGLRISGGDYSYNSGTGIYALNYSTDSNKKIYDLRIDGVKARGNSKSGIVVGEFTEDDDISTSYRLYSHTDLENFNSSITNCIVISNTYYGISLSGQNVVCSDNIINNNGSSSFGGIVVNAQSFVIANNTIESNAAWGIDAGGCRRGTIVGNQLRFNGGSTYQAMNVGGVTDVNIKDNYFEGNGSTSATQIRLNAVDSGGVGNSVPYVNSRISITGNTFYLTDSRAAMTATDYCTSIFFTGNHIVGGTISTSVVAICPNPVIQGNYVYGSVDQTLTVDGSGIVIVPDVLEEFSVNTTTTITGIVPYSRSLVGEDGLAWIQVTAGGTGYPTNTTVGFSGGGGSGAAGTVFVYNGAVLGVVLTNRGSGYTSAPTVTFTGSGGSGATATAQVGLPVPNRKKVLMYSYDAVTVNRSAANGPDVISATGTNITLATDDIMYLYGLGGVWHVMNASS